MKSAKVIGRSIGKSKVSVLEIGSKSIVTPSYFPAISSFGVRHEVSDLAKLLATKPHPSMLISAYDLWFEEKFQNRNLLADIDKYTSDAECILFIDSGQYESYHRRSSDWTFTKYAETLSKLNFDLFTSYDPFPEPNESSEQYRQRLYSLILRSRGSCRSDAGFIPIIHPHNPRDESTRRNDLVTSVKRLLYEFPDISNIIAIPERDCGDSIIEKAITIHEVRKTMDAVCPDLNLHILGCGHPLSILIFLVCGADTFDSLDWIRYALQIDAKRPEDFSHLDSLACKCKTCINKEQTDYAKRVLLHNVAFYNEFIPKVRKSIIDDDLRKFMKTETEFGSKILRELERKGVVK